MSDLQPWQRLDGDTRFSNPFWRYQLDRVRLPDGREWDYHYAQTPGSVMIVPILPPANGTESGPTSGEHWGDHRLLMVRQFRYLMNAVCLEFPAGGIKPPQSPLDAARLELREETGFDARDLSHIGEFNPCKGIVAETCHIFLARDLFPRPAPPDPSEAFERVTLTVREFEAKITAGEITDGMTLAAWMLACATRVGKRV